MPAEQRAIDAIRRESAIADTQAGHPLPLASGWMDGGRALGFTPEYQIQQIKHGQYILPWLKLWDAPKPGAPDGYPSSADALYYELPVKYLAEHHLPLCFTMLEWEVLMAQFSAEYVRQGGKQQPAPLSPFAATEPWHEIGRAWARHPTLRQLQKLYPDPPLVLIVQDSEYPRLSANDLHASFSSNADPESIARRRAIGDAWIEKYRALLQGFRAALESQGWRKHTVVVGYDQFLTSSMGRWGGWIDYSLYVPGRTEPWPDAWDGASAPYYQHDYAQDSDFTVWSPQIEAMNWVAELDAIYRKKPAYWFEISTWDGQEPGQPSDKLRFYVEHGQRYGAARYGGMVQFGMWLLRPRVVREFRNPEHDRIRFGSYYEAILAAVARVHEDPTLRKFWRDGRLLPNHASQNPYQANLPAELAARPRWFLLDSPQNPPRPWESSTRLRVFALAIERDNAPRREWLVYAFSPQDDSLDTEVAIPEGPSVRVRATASGAFTLLREGEDIGRPVG